MARAAAPCTASASAPPATCPPRSSASASSCSTSSCTHHRNAAFCAWSAARASFLIGWSLPRAQAGCARGYARRRVRHLVDLQHRVHLASALQDLPAPGRWSARQDQPEAVQLNRIRSRRSEATLAAAYRRVWYVTGPPGGWTLSVPKCAMESRLAPPGEAGRSSGMAWLISGRCGTGGPLAITVHCVGLLHPQQRFGAFSRMSAL